MLYRSPDADAGKMRVAVWSKALGDATERECIDAVIELCSAPSKEARRTNIQPGDLLELIYAARLRKMPTTAAQLNAPRCPSCSGTGFQIVLRDGLEFAARCHCRPRRT